MNTVIQFLPVNHLIKINNYKKRIEYRPLKRKIGKKVATCDNIFTVDSLIKQQTITAEPQASIYLSESSGSNKECLQNIKKHRLLGQGSFGEVWLISDSKNKGFYAMKMQEKRRIIEKKQHLGVMREKDIMEKLNHPFVLKLSNTFQDNHYLYMVTEFYSGGNLHRLMMENKFCGGRNEQMPKFYSACILEGLSYMHKKNICYRDLKPENVLLGSDGYPVLADMGFAKVINKKSYTLCGTPLYLAPEIILQKGKLCIDYSRKKTKQFTGHDQSADMWSMGVLLYELIFGKNPFYILGMNQKALFKRACIGKYKIGHKCSSEVADLIKNMLLVDPNDRIKSHNLDEDNIHNHQWFKEVDFNLLLNKRFKAPWVPEIVDPVNSKYFSVSSTTVRTGNRSTLTDIDQLKFLGF